jgi:hypothetical protein
MSPRRATDLSLRPAEHATWSPATVVSGRPMVQLLAEIDVTNTSECSVVLVSARLRKPAAEGLVRLYDRKRGTAGSYPLEPFVSTRASVYFYVSLPEPPAGTTVVGDVGFVDQFGNTHWLEKVRFRGRPHDDPF